MADEPKMPEGLKVERTATGGFRFELPPERGRWAHLILGLPFTAAFGGFALFWAWTWWHQSKSGGQRLFGMIFVLPFLAVALFMLRRILLSVFGRNSLEVDAEAVSICRRTPLFETRRRLPLAEIVSVTADTQHSDDSRLEYLAIKTAKKEHRVAKGMDRESIEWLGGRIAALADAARAGGTGSPGLIEVFERDLRADRFEDGKVRAEDIRELQASDQPPPADSGLEVLEQRSDVLRLRIAAKGGGMLILFGVVWTLFTGGILIPLWLSGKSSPGIPGWVLPLIAITFVSIGLLVLGIGLGLTSLVEEIEFRPGRVACSKRSRFGTKTKQLTGPGLTISRQAGYQQNTMSAGALSITNSAGQRLGVGGGLPAAAQLWLAARAGAVLGSLALDLPGELVLPSLPPGSAPPEGAGIEVIEDSAGSFAARLTARGGGGALSFAIVCLGITALVGGTMLCFRLQVFGPTEGPAWKHFLWLLPSTAVGIRILLYALRQNTLIEDLSVHPGFAEWSAASALGRSHRRLEGRITIERQISYQAGGTTYRNLILRDESGRKAKFGTNLRPDAQLWMLAAIVRVLGPEAAGVTAGPAGRSSS
jgi:hypothetical protein